MVRALVRAAVPEVNIRSVRRELIRPLVIASAGALLLALPVLIVADAAAVVAGFVLWVPVVAFLIFLASQIGTLQRAAEELGEGLSLHISLTGLLTSDPRLLPRLGDYAMSYGSLHALLELIAQARPATIVELGPGASTVYLQHLLDAAGREGTVYGVEHDSSYSIRLRESKTHHSLGRVVLLDAPLEPLTLDGWEGTWYSQAALSQLPDHVDVLVVDGPPRRIGPRSRYPAFPALRDRLAVGSFIFVDDAGRPSESESIEMWLRTGSLEVVNRGPTYAILRCLR